MDESTRAYIAKIAGALIAIGIGVASLTNPPIFVVDRLYAGALISAGLIALGVNIGATVAAGREAAVARKARRASH